MDGVGQKVLERLVAKLGPEETALQLGVSPAIVGRFLSGHLHVPERLLLRALDLLQGPEDLPPVADESPDGKGPSVE